MPRSSAQAPTGERTSWRPRPAGASGRVTTATQLVAGRGDRVQGGQRRPPGVPAKTRRIDRPSPNEPAGACGLTLTAGGASASYQSAPRGSAASRPCGPPASSRSRKSTPSRWSVSCWHAAGHQAGADELDRVAVLVEALGDDVLPALGVEVDARDRQAALRAVLLLLVGEVQHRVDQVADDVVDVEGEHPQADAELRRGQAGAALVEHRLGQVRDQPAQLLVEVDDRLGRRAQHRVAEQADRLDGHAAYSSTSSTGSAGHRQPVPRTSVARDVYERRRRDRPDQRPCGRLTPSSRLRTGRPGRPGSRTGEGGLAGAAHRGRRVQRRGQRAARRRAAPGPASAPASSPAGTGPSTSAPAGSRAAASSSATAVRPAGQGRHPGRRREAQLAALGQLPRRRTRPGPSAAAPAPAASAAVGDHDHLPPRPRRAGQRGGGQPAAQRLLAGPQVGPGQQRPGVEQQHRAVAALGDRLGARRGDDQRPARPGTAVEHARRGPRCAPARPGRPGPAPRRSAGRRSPRPAAAGRRSAGRRSRPPAGRTSGRPATRVRRAQRQRPGAVRRSGPACGSPRRRPPAGSRAAAPAPAPARRRPARRGPPARPGWAAGPWPRPGRGPAAVSSPVGATAGARAPHASSRSAAISCAQPVSTSSCASAVRANAADQRRRAGQLGPGEQHLAGVRVGRARLGVQVVAVVPDRDQPEVGDRREHRRPGADDHRHLAAAGGAGTAGTARPARARRCSATCRPGPSTRGQRRVEPVEVAGVGHHDHRAAPAVRRVAATASASRRRPVLARQRGPAPPAARRPSASARRNAAPGRVAPQPPGRSGLDGGRARPRRRPRRRRRRSRRGSASAARPRRLAPRPGRGGAGRPAAARRRGVPAYRSATARASRGDLGGRAPARARRPCPGRRAGRRARTSAARSSSEAVDELAGEADPHPDAGLRAASSSSAGTR